MLLGSWRGKEIQGRKGLSLEAARPLGIQQGPWHGSKWPASQAGPSLNTGRTRLTWMQWERGHEEFLRERKM